MSSWYIFGELVKLVGPIIGGGLSGWLLARWQIAAKRREQAEQTNQERRALLLLVDSEVTANTVVLEKFKAYIQNALKQHEEAKELYEGAGELKEDKKRWLGKMALLSAQARWETERTLSTATWDSSKVRLALLLEPGEVEVLVGYYNEVLPNISALQHIDFTNKDDLELNLSTTKRALNISNAAIQDIARIQEKHETGELRLMNRGSRN